MTKNPYINAFAALAYIVGIVLVLNFVTKRASFQGNNLIAPITMLSVFTLSAGVMGYIFISQPVLLYLDGKKKEAVRLFLHTGGVFAAIVAVILAVVLSGIIH